jgi:hypothetical protein
MKQNYATSITQNPLLEGRQLELFNYTGIRHKPQILSSPGVSPKQHDRYRVVVGNEVLGDQLTLDDVFQLAERGKQ